MHEINALREKIQSAKHNPEQIHLEQALEHIKNIEKNIGFNPDLDKVKQSILQSQSALKDRENNPKNYDESIEETIEVCNRVDFPLCY